MTEKTSILPTLNCLQILRILRMVTIFLVLLILKMSSANFVAQPVEHWAVENWINLPEWLKISGQTRVRYETVGTTFRPGSSGSDQAWAFRNLIRADLDLRPVAFTGEIMDARQAGMDNGSPIGTDDVNTLNLLQAFAHWKSDSVINEEPVLQFKLGRQTLSLGSRRLIARNRFRNTINAFNGVHSRWKPAEQWDAQAFVFIPLQREPSDVQSLLDNQIQLDRENLKTLIPGVSVRYTKGPWNTEIEGYALGVIEDDSSRYLTLNRRLATTGIRWQRFPSSGGIDFEAEAIFQSGVSRSTDSVSDQQDLTHLAYMIHFQAGYSFDTG